MSLPKQVQQALDDAEALEKQLAPPSPEGDPPADNPPADPANPPAAAEPPAAPAETPPAPEPPKVETTDWEHRFKTLQGVHDADQRRYQAQVQQLTDQVMTLTNQIAKLAEKPQATAPAPAVTDKDVETFGPDVVDLVKRASAAAVAEARSLWEADKGRLEETIASLKTKTESAVENQAVTNRARYFDDLRRQVTDLDALQQDENFLAYCRAIDPIQGVPRQHALNRAFDDFDVQRTVAYYAAYKATLPPAPTPPAPPQPNRDLERQVTPSGGAKPAVTPTDAAASRIWTGAEVDQFYTDVRKGAYRGREAEQAAIEAQIDQAAATNRIR
ncbi:MAG: hypothetical protein ACXWCO_00700 [Caldimonas sp.]